MEVPIIIEPVTGNGYRVTGAGGLSVGLTAEGATLAEAIDRLPIRFGCAGRRSEAGRAERRASAAPWKQDAGYLHDDPLMSPGVRRWRSIVVSSTKTPRHYEPLRPRYRHPDPLLPRRPLRGAKVDARSPTELAISIMTVDEQLTGWYTLTRQARQPDEIARAYAHLGDAVSPAGRWRHPPLHGIGHRAGRPAQGPPAQRTSHGPGESPPSPWRIMPWSSPETGLTLAASPA